VSSSFASFSLPSFSLLSFSVVFSSPLSASLGLFLSPSLASFWVLAASTSGVSEPASAPLSLFVISGGFSLLPVSVLVSP